ncbi:MAG: cell wall metabolism sensor histidine kinase WalK, partial [Candidatus Eremiobacteraeota bacterium]|nr:cell wall metabolism sensor histidine kinase WalK [Candidatus Eremiobacteraeota bacterium]
KILLMNPAAEKIFGIDRESALNKHRSILFSGLDLEDIHQKAVKEEKTFAKEIALNKPTQLFFRILITPMKTVEGVTQGVISLLQDITELRKVAEMKSQFVSMVTHDLKTPLTSIQGFVEIILTRNPSLEKIHNYLQIVREETARLVRIINNLLDLAKLESGKFKLNSSSINLIQLIQEALPILSKKSAIHKILFHPSVPVSNVWADPDLIIQVLYNLLSNAIKYSPEGGKVEIRIKPAGNFVEVDVEDEGIGISPEKLPKLFEKFYRVDSKITKGIEGTGIGLANVKYIVEAHGGSLKVKSSEGKGSVFTFSLPVFIPYPNMPPHLKEQQDG